MKLKVDQFMDCILPMPVIRELKYDCWGADTVVPRDQDNGLEDKILDNPPVEGRPNYTYWDGSIIHDTDGCGKYHMFASRWDEADGFEKVNGTGGWSDSVAMEAVSDNLYGPYDQKERILWPDNQGGKGHNVFAFRLKEGDPAGKYGIIVSDTRQGDIFTTDSLDEGEWAYQCSLKTEGGAFLAANICIIVRPDGKYQAMNRNGAIALCEGGITDTFTVINENLWKDVEGLPTTDMEDPVMWYSGELYHCIVNQWSSRQAYYLVSENGIDGWKLMKGKAYSPLDAFLTYEGTDISNKWNKIERPNVFIEDGIVKAMTFAVLDLEKEADVGNDGHASKVIVVPFDGEALNRFAKEALGK